MCASFRLYTRRSRENADVIAMRLKNHCAWPTNFGSKMVVIGDPTILPLLFSIKHAWKDLLP
jgi:hypothetical protein